MTCYRHSQVGKATAELPVGQGEAVVRQMVDELVPYSIIGHRNKDFLM